MNGLFCVLYAEKTYESSVLFQLCFFLNRQLTKTVYAKSVFFFKNLKFASEILWIKKFDKSF